MDLKIEVSQEVLDAHKKICQKLGKYAIFKADEKKEKVILECEGDLDATFDEFRDALPDNQPRYVKLTRLDLN